MAVSIASNLISADTLVSADVEHAYFKTFFEGPASCLELREVDFFKNAKVSAISTIVDVTTIILKGGRSPVGSICYSC